MIIFRYRHTNRHCIIIYISSPLSTSWFCTFLNCPSTFQLAFVIIISPYIFLQWKCFYTYSMSCLFVNLHFLIHPCRNSQLKSLPSNWLNDIPGGFGFKILMKKTSELEFWFFRYICVNNKPFLHSNFVVITRATCAFKRGVTVEQLCPCPCPPHDDGLARPAACCWTSGACSLPA